MFNAETVVHLIGDPLSCTTKAKAVGVSNLTITGWSLVKRLNDLPLETWVNEGRTFAAAMRAQRER